MEAPFVTENLGEVFCYTKDMNMSEHIFRGLNEKQMETKQMDIKRKEKEVC